LGIMNEKIENQSTILNQQSSINLQSPILQSSILLH
jgi:hypothetical protein